MGAHGLDFTVGAAEDETNSAAKAFRVKSAEGCGSDKAD